MLNYNLFRHKDEADLFCAVPEDIPVPIFLNNKEWVYSYPIDKRLFARFDASTQSCSLGSEVILLQPKRRTLTPSS